MTLRTRAVQSASMRLRGRFVALLLASVISKRPVLGVLEIVQRTSMKRMEGLVGLVMIYSAPLGSARIATCNVNSSLLAIILLYRLVGTIRVFWSVHRRGDRPGLVQAPEMSWTARLVMAAYVAVGNAGVGRTMVEAHGWTDIALWLLACRLE